MGKMIPFEGSRSSKAIPYRAAYTYLAHISEIPPWNESHSSIMLIALYKESEKAEINSRHPFKGGTWSCLRGVTLACLAGAKRGGGGGR